MSDRQLRGKVFDDGVTRYYDPTKHSWVTREEIEKENKTNEVENYIYIIGFVLVIGFCIYGFWSIWAS